LTHQRTGVTTTIAIAIFIVGLLIGLGGMYAVGPSLFGTTTTPTTTGLKGTITLGDLVAFTGDLASQGQRDKAAVNMAISDINAWLQSIGANYTFAVDHEDSATDANVVQQKIETMNSKGIKVYIGPEWSGGALQILTYANQNHLVLISESSTSLKAAITGDYLFRLVPADDAQGKALARLVTQSGIQAIAVIHRNDPYGNGLATAFEDDFKALGGSVLVDQQYDPASTDFSTQLSTMKTAVDSAVASKGAAHVAVEMVSFDEGGVVLQQAQSSYSSLLSVTWFGCDGQAELDPFITSAKTPSLQVKMISTLYSPSGSSKYQAFVNKFQSTSGLSIQSYTASAYDCVWVAALSIIAAGTYDGALVQKILPAVANNYYGPSGWPNLNAAGDRTVANYDVWSVQQLANGSAIWGQIGTWDATADHVTFTQQP
jgi:branched-chain amino acid transport system substrate-binding protein